MYMLSVFFITLYRLGRIFSPETSNLSLAQINFLLYIFKYYYFPICSMLRVDEGNKHMLDTLNLSSHLSFIIPTYLYFHSMFCECSSKQFLNPHFNFQQCLIGICCQYWWDFSSNQIFNFLLHSSLLFQHNIPLNFPRGW